MAIKGRGLRNVPIISPNVAEAKFIGIASVVAFVSFKFPVSQVRNDG